MDDTVDATGRGGVAGDRPIGMRDERGVVGKHPIGMSGVCARIGVRAKASVVEFRQLISLVSYRLDFGGIERDCIY